MQKAGVQKNARVGREDERDCRARRSARLHAHGAHHARDWTEEVGFGFCAVDKSHVVVAAQVSDERIGYVVERREPLWVRVYGV